jgi:predicted transposase YbfD/YdcC
VVTGDAQFCQRDLSEAVVAGGGDYFWVVKENQPTLFEDIATLFAEPPWGEAFAEHVSRTRHGDRAETRALRASAALAGFLDWPHAGQVCEIERAVTRKGGASREVAYAVTSLAPDRAPPARLQATWRGHWGIENRLHWVRDVTLGEDKSQVRTGSAPQVMAAVRNTAIAVVRRAGYANIAEGLRHFGAHPDHALATLGLSRQQ